MGAPIRPELVEIGAVAKDLSVSLIKGGAPGVTTRGRGVR
jgi:hypothetical protein